MVTCAVTAPRPAKRTGTVVASMTARKGASDHVAGAVKQGETKTTARTPTVRETASSRHRGQVADYYRCEQHRRRDSC